MNGIRITTRGARLLPKGASLVVALSMPLLALAAGVPTLDTVEVTSDSKGLVGAADTASVGTVSRQQIENRPIYRAGELLETTPGLIITQHSGEGKANQYFLRGFNLDHGTDLAITVDGMPVNLRGHAHGQGYSDLNFVIPEFISGLQYKKGPYYSDEGDFAAAGAVHLDYSNTLPTGFASAVGGTDGFGRVVLGNSSQIGPGHLLYGLELFHNDGPWTHAENFRRVNGIVRYSQGDSNNGFDITGLAYAGKGDATNQIAERAVGTPLLPSIFGSLNTTDGSKSNRFSLSGAWQRTVGNSITHANVYVIRSELKLFSDFTYFLDFDQNQDGSGLGDQFLQCDDRILSGLNISQTWLGKWGGFDVENTIGIQTRNDDVDQGLQRTHQRVVFETTRLDHTNETSLALYLQNRTQWLEKFRTVVGARVDYFHAEIDSNNAANSGTANDNIVNPQVSLIFGPWAKTEYYISVGGGFHSNDARGATISQDPSTCRPGDNISDSFTDSFRTAPNVTCAGADKVPLLVRAKGYEIGVRTALVPHLQSTLALFLLDVDSELVFSGDAGNTQAGRPSRRMGIEFSNFYTPTNWLIIDGDVAFSDAHFRDNDPVGDHIPGAVEGVISVGAEVNNLGPWFGGLRFRYFGPRALIEDNSARSSDTKLVEGRIGYKISKKLSGVLEIFNLLDSEDDNVSYFYNSRIPSQIGGPDGPQVGPEGVADNHFHPVESRSFRVGLSYNFD